VGPSPSPSGGAWVPLETTPPKVAPIGALIGVPRGASAPSIGIDEGDWMYLVFGFGAKRVYDEGVCEVYPELHIG